MHFLNRQMLIKLNKFESIPMQLIIFLHSDRTEQINITRFHAPVPNNHIRFVAMIYSEYYDLYCPPSYIYLMFTTFGKLDPFSSSGVNEENCYTIRLIRKS
jgi:hypothetical protein